MTPTQLLAQLGYPHDPQAEAAIDRLARERAAEELRAIADAAPVTSAMWLRARAAALAADDRTPP